MEHAYSRNRFCKRNSLDFCNKTIPSLLPYCCWLSDKISLYDFVWVWPHLKVYKFMSWKRLASNVISLSCLQNSSLCQTHYCLWGLWWYKFFHQFYQNLIRMGQGEMYFSLESSQSMTAKTTTTPKTSENC